MWCGVEAGNLRTFVAPHTRSFEIRRVCTHHSDQEFIVAITVDIRADDLVNTAGMLIVQTAEVVQYTPCPPYASNTVHSIGRFSINRDRVTVEGLESV